MTEFEIITESAEEWLKEIDWYEPAECEDKSYSTEMQKVEVAFLLAALEQISLHLEAIRNRV